MPITARLPVPPNMQRLCAAILVLHNTGYPRHFLNGCYFILRPSEAFELLTAENSNLEHDDSQDSLDSVFSLIRCTDSQWHNLLHSIPFFSQHFPLTISSRVLGWSSNTKGVPSLVPKDASWTLSLKPSSGQRFRMLLQCYATQVWTNSSITDGSSYFRREYPAKKCLVGYETTFAWVCGGIGPVGYIQYISLQADSTAKPDILITGLSIEDSHRRRGFARGLISVLINCVWPCNEIWVAVQDDNIAAFSLYLQCGFAKRSKQWDMTILNRFDKL